MAKEQVNESAERATGEPGEQEPEDPIALRDTKISELTDDLKRLQAEFENYKKRVERERNDRAKLANQRLILDLLPILDSFDKALENSRTPAEADQLRKGLKGLQKQLLQTLQAEGLKEIRTDGAFDPFLHEAILREERDDVEDGKILEVYQKGYTLQQWTLRPARVKVARPKATRKVPVNENDDIHDTRDDETVTDEDKNER